MNERDTANEHSKRDLGFDVNATEGSPSFSTTWLLAPNSRAFLSSLLASKHLNLTILLSPRY